MTSGDPSRRHCVQVVIGARHQREGRPCQDAGRSGLDGEALWLAVADGHGQSACAADGAEVAVAAAERVLRRLRGLVDSLPAPSLHAVSQLAKAHLREQLVRTWRQLLEARAPGAANDLTSYGSTVLAALWTPAFLLVLRLGDGDLWLVEDGAARALLPEADIGDETLSLCSPQAEHGARVLLLPAPRGEALLLLATDGYSKSYEDPQGMGRVAEDYLGLIQRLGFAAVRDRLPGFLARVSQGGCGDDITCGLLYLAAHTADERAD